MLREGGKKIFDVYLTNSEELLTGDIVIDDLVALADGFVGADIETLVREAKLAAMREFIHLMKGRTNREMDKAIENVKIT